MRHALHAPGSIHGTASSLASIPAAPFFFSPEESLELGADQWPRVETDFLMRSQDGNIAATAATHHSDLTSLLKFVPFQD